MRKGILKELDNKAKTGRRLAFAQWLVRPDHPLTARVMVNRIWKEHFGKGIVKTLANFGKSGAAPTHPELLDWLAVELVRQGWSVKAMQRLMMTSSAYRQSSTVTSIHEEKDPDNVLLSRMGIRRMGAEVLNDTMLLISGRLDETRYGVPRQFHHIRDVWRRPRRPVFMASIRGQSATTYVPRGLGAHSPGQE